MSFFWWEMLAFSLVFHWGHYKVVSSTSQKKVRMAVFRYSYTTCLALLPWHQGAQSYTPTLYTWNWNFTFYAQAHTQFLRYPIENIDIALYGLCIDFFQNTYALNTSADISGVFWTICISPVRCVQSYIKHGIHWEVKNRKCRHRIIRFSTRWLCSCNSIQWQNFMPALLSLKEFSGKYCSSRRVFAGKQDYAWRIY